MPRNSDQCVTGKGSISISRVTSSEEPSNYMKITIRDEKSFTDFICVKMSMEDFALALTGFSNQPVEFELRNTDIVGLTHEYCHMNMRIPRHLMIIQHTDRKTFDSKVREYLMKKRECYEGGWTPDVGDVGNSHKRVDSGFNQDYETYSLCFHRWVRDKTDEPQNEGT